MFKNIIRRVEDLLSPSVISKPADKPKQKSVISTYKEQTGNGLISTIFNKGNFGEFSSYGKLAKLPGYHKALFNIYIPNGKEQTTEIDLSEQEIEDILLLHPERIENGPYSYRKAGPIRKS